MERLDGYIAREAQAVCIGVFDGVHRGHQALLTRASAFPALPVALTFDPHPAAVFSPGRLPLMLGTLPERAALLQQHGAERVIVASFDRAFAAKTPIEFIETVLVERLRASAVIVGEDFRFGCDRTGNCQLLQTAGDRYGFTVAIVPPVFVQGVPARSTAIRQMLDGGEAQEASWLLGRAYRLSGTVVEGRKLGRTLGFPTANLETNPGILVPGSGVYAGIAERADGSRWRTAISIGTNPTVTPESRQRTVEAFLMDGFADSLYGERLSLEFHAFLRPTVKFDGLDALIAQMKSDVAAAALQIAMP